VHIEPDLGRTSGSAHPPNIAEKGIREVKVAEKLGRHAVEAGPDWERSEDLLGLIRVYDVDYGILSDRVVRNEQVASVVVDHKSRGKASWGPVERSVSGLYSLRSNLLNFIADQQTDVEVIVAVNDDVLRPLGFGGVKGRNSREFGALRGRHREQHKGRGR
jgi:hypothetical protein